MPSGGRPEVVSAIARPIRAAIALWCQKMLYVLLAAAVGWVLVRMWTAPVQAIALVLTMHGLRQVAVNVLPQLASSPYLMNLAVGCLVAVALGLTSIRGRSNVPRGAYLASWGIYVLFYALYAAYAVAADAFQDESVFVLFIRMAPYVVLQLLATTWLVGASSPTELRGALLSTWFICLAIIGIALTDSSVRVDEADASFRLMLRSQQEESQASNPLALADVGVMLMVLTLHVLPGAARAALPSLARIDWLASIASSGRIALVGALALVMLWISRAEPLVALVAIAVTTMMARSHSRAGLVVVTLVGLSLAVLSGAGQSAADVLVEWFPRLETVDEGFSIRISIIERLCDRYFSGGFGVLFFGLGPGYSLMNFGLYPHNHLVECLVELGLIGLVIAVIGPITHWRKGVAVMRATPPGAALQNACFFHTMLTFAILASMKRGSIVQPDTFMWGAALGFLHAKGWEGCCGIDASRSRPAVRPLAPPVPLLTTLGVGQHRSLPGRHRHAAA